MLLSDKKRLGLTSEKPAEPPTPIIVQPAPVILPPEGKKLVEKVGVFVTACACVAAVWQGYLIREQLTAADKNRGAEALLNSVWDVCDAVANYDPVEDPVYYARTKHLPPKGPYVMELKRNVIHDISTVDYFGFLNARATSMTALDHAADVYRLWLGSSERTGFDAMQKALLAGLSSERDPEVGPEETQNAAAVLTFRLDCSQMSAFVAGWLMDNTTRAPDLMSVAIRPPKPYTFKAP